MQSVPEIKTTTNSLLEDKFNFNSTTTNNHMMMKITMQVMEISTEMAVAGIRAMIQLTWTICPSRRGTSTAIVTNKDLASTLVIRTPETIRVEETGIGMTEMVKIKEDTDESVIHTETFIIKLMKN